MIKKEIKQFSFTAGEYKDIECSLPATVYSVLSERELIKGTPAELSCISCDRNVFSESVFKSKIEFSKSEASKKYILLRVSGVVSKSEIIFNDRSYGVISNVNRVAVFDITDRVCEGENTLVIESSETSGRKHHILNSGEVSKEYDTAPFIYDAGIVGNVEILMSDTPQISAVRTEQIYENDGRINLLIDLDMIGTADNIRSVASLVSPSGKIYFGGAYEGKIRISVPDPELWWPRGFGSQGLYKLSVTLYHDGEPKDTYEKKIGLRRVELIPDENGVPRIYVNGVKIFSLGASYLPENSFLAHRSRKETEKLIKIAAKTNMNTLAVFDEGVLPDESFYELCDKYGILIWQSLSVPYVAPPAAGVFAAGLYDAIDDTVERLSSHPSVVITFLSITESNKGMMRLFPDAVEEFRSVCLKIIDPVLNKIKNSIFVDNTDKLFPYDERYRKCENKKARTEYYTVPDEETLRKFLPDGEYNLFSKTAEVHTPSRERCLDMISDITSEMRFPTGFSELSYAATLSASNALSRSVLSARTVDSACASAVLRPFNDGYYAISSSFVDYCKRKKPICYKLACAYAPIAVNAVPCEEKISLYVKNDSKKEYEGKLLYALYDVGNKCWYENTVSISLSAGESCLAAESDLSKYLSGAAENYYVIFELFTEKGITFSGTERFVPIKHFNFADPAIKAEVSGMGCKFTLKLNSVSYVTGAHISFAGVKISPDTDFVDIVRTMPTVVNFETESAISPEELNSRVVILTPYTYGK